MDQLNNEQLGLKIIENFITEEEEQLILSQIDKSPSKKNQKSRNAIKRYGSSAPYKGNIVSKNIPEFLEFLSDKIVESGHLEVKPDSVSINEYMVGQQIDYHIDSKDSGPIISILSLLSPATMMFKYKREEKSIIIQPRTLIQMSGDIRDKWQHAIAPVENTGYSIVFRCSPQVTKNEKK